MTRINKILFPTDFSRCSNQALAHALHLAKKHGARLHILRAAVLFQEDAYNLANHLPDIDEFYLTLDKLTKADITRQLKQHDPGGVAIVLAQERGYSVADVILDYAKAEEIDLIVMGTHGRRGLRKLFLGSVASEVVRLSPYPVLTVREQEASEIVLGRENILIPIDFSGYSKEVLALGKEMVVKYGARLHLLHVVEETVHPAFYGTGKTTILEMRPGIIDRCKTAMVRLMEQVPGPVSYLQCHTVIGHAAKEIIRFADQHSIDMIVIGTHGRTGLKRLLLGSVAEKTVRMASCPVLTMKSLNPPLPE